MTLGERANRMAYKQQQQQARRLTRGKTASGGETANLGRFDFGTFQREERREMSVRAKLAKLTSRDDRWHTQTFGLVNQRRGCEVKPLDGLDANANGNQLLLFT